MIRITEKDLQKIFNLPNYTIDSIKSYSNNLVMRSPEGKTFGISLWEWKTELENYLN